MRPIQIGDARGVVAEIHLDRHGLEWLAGQCPAHDGFTKELNDALRQIDEREAREEGVPELRVVLVGEGEGIHERE